MAAALPVTKLAGLFVKTFAKPLSKGIKNKLGRYDASKNALVCIGQVNHSVTSYMTIWASGYRVKQIKPIKTEQALKAGAEFVGEGFVLAVSATVVIFEYNRSVASTARKNEEKRERIRADQAKLQAKLNTLDIRIKAVEDLVKKQQQLEESTTILNRVVPVGGTEKPKYVEPPKEQLVPISDDFDPNTDASVSKRDTSGSGSIEPTAATSLSSDTVKKEQPSSWWKFW